MNRNQLHKFLLACALSVLFSDFANAQPKTKTTPKPAPVGSDVLDDAQWKQIDQSVERGLAWLATKQQPDGSFESIDRGQPAITSLCVMAFLAQGESPVDGEYQKQLTNAVGYILAQQKANGLIAVSAPDTTPVPRDVDYHTVGQSSAYNHAISGLALAEVYGQCSEQQTKRLAPVIEKAVAVTLKMQGWDGKQKHNVGGWRYLNLPFPGQDSDLSITGWQLMFLRSAKNAGFDVPDQSIEAAVKFVENCFHKQNNRRVHGYVVDNKDACSRAMAGAGVLALAHAGKHGSQEARASGEWILGHDFSNYNNDTPVYGVNWAADRYHYGAILCTQAMFLLGDKYWAQFFPPLVEVLLANQAAEGSWPPEKTNPEYGSCYSTSLCILSLSVPNQMLPIFQR